jgi:CO dehydrogenase maturation factor
MSGSIIAFAGKGGVGKTTLACLVLRQLIRAGRRPVLAVDADPNATLGSALGAEVAGTIADLRDHLRQAAQSPTEIPKQRLLDLWLAELLSEQQGFDLLTMGRPEGPECYCYVNGLLRRYLSLLRENYACILVDCEAGMEYLSRLVVDDVATIVLVAQATPVGLRTVQRISALADSLPIRVRRRVLALNQVSPAAPPLPKDSAAPEVGGVAAVVEVPFDSDLAARCLRGQPIDDGAGREARPAIEQLAQQALGLAAEKAAAE